MSLKLLLHQLQWKFGVRARPPVLRSFGHHSVVFILAMLIEQAPDFVDVAQPGTPVFSHGPLPRIGVGAEFKVQLMLADEPFSVFIQTVREPYAAVPRGTRCRPSQSRLVPLFEGNQPDR